MKSDFGNGSNKVLCIMVNLSALKRKIGKENSKTNPNQGKIDVWEVELRKVQSALNKHRIIA